MKFCALLLLALAFGGCVRSPCEQSYEKLDQCMQLVEPCAEDDVGCTLDMLEPQFDQLFLSVAVVEDDCTGSYRELAVEYQQCELEPGDRCYCRTSDM